MSEHCPQDGGFIGDAGCTHPNHQHSELVKGVIAAAKAKKPHSISASDAEVALKEGFYVDGLNGKRIGFGKSLLKHFNEDPHDPDDVKNRKRLLLFAVDTAMHPDKTTNNNRGIPGRTAYCKAFNSFGVIAITGKESEDIEYVFNYVLDGRTRRKR